MNGIQRYLREEVVEDYADGIINRREALRQLGLLGVAAAVAVPLLAACAGGNAPSPPAPSTAPPAPSESAPAGASPLPTEAVTFAAGSRTLMGAWAKAATPKGSVLVIHENRGLTDHIRSVTGRLAAAGYSAHAVDLLSEEGGTRTTRSSTTPASGTTRRPRARGRS
jgi:carboxymethylenebutenolidase